jgi:hypothetical protein
MAMTPEEYAAREFRVDGWDKDEPTYAPGSNPSEQDPNIQLVMNGGVRPVSEPVAVEPLDAEKLAMAHEYNFILPISLRRAELVTEAKKHNHLDARTNFWNALSFTVLIAPILAFIAVLVS